MSQAIPGSVCLIPLTTGVSGTERVVADLVRALHEHKRPTSLVVPNLQKLREFAAGLKPFVSGSAEFGPVNGRSSAGRNFLPALKILRNIRPEIVHFHCPNQLWGLDIVVAARMAGVPIIVRTEHNPVMGAPGFLAGTILRIANMGVARFTYVSKGNQKRYESMFPYRAGRGRTIPNGIDETLFSCRPSSDARHLRDMFNFRPETKIAVYVGNFGDRRSLRPLFHAFKYLLADPSTVGLARDWRLLIVGAGPREEQILPEELGIAPYVHFAGFRTDVSTILPACNLYVNASNFEGMSIAMLEAWAAGLPVLSTQVDGIEDVIGPQAFRRLMVPHRDVRSFARAWAEHLRDDPERAAVHVLARSTVRSQFTVSRMIEEYFRLYADVSSRNQLIPSH